MGFVPQYSFDVDASNGLSSVLVPLLVLGMADSAKYSIALFLSWGIVLGLGLMGTQIPV